jgi:ABC-type transport system involved in multi-copper enzyme maturation permease subunit
VSKINVIAWPLIIREMASAAGSPAQYRLRTLVGGLGLFSLWVSTSKEVPVAESGRVMFEAIHAAVLLLLAIVAPILTADTISRERREGTLDLLFLTPLTAKKIISSKFIVQVLRMLVIWLVCVPLVTVPFLAGGLDGRTVGLSLAMEFSLLAIGLVSGLAVSLFAVRPFTAIFGALLLTSLTALVDLSAVGAWLAPSLGFFGGFEEFPVLRRAMLGVAAAIVMPVLGSGKVSPLVIWPNTALVLFLATAAVLALGRVLEKRRLKEGASVRQIWFRRIFLTPRFWKGFFRQTMSRRMDRNPLIWLEYRTAWSRSGRWVLCGALILIESYGMLVSPLDREFMGLQAPASFILLLLLALSAASSFQKERESGAFELLLVAPFTERSLVEGRLQAVWSYYWPVAACLYFALRLKSFLPILTGTVFVGLLAPLYLWDILRQLFWYFDKVVDLPTMGIGTSLLSDPAGVAFFTLCCHGILIYCLIDKSCARLRAREFAF